MKSNRLYFFAIFIFAFHGILSIASKNLGFDHLIITCFLIVVSFSEVGNLIFKNAKNVEQIKAKKFLKYLTLMAGGGLSLIVFFRCKDISFLILNEEYSRNMILSWCIYIFCFVLALINFSFFFIQAQAYNRSIIQSDH